MSEWVALLIEGAVHDGRANGVYATDVERPSHHDARSERNAQSAAEPSHDDMPASPSYQALGPKKKLSPVVRPATQSLAETSLPIYEAPPFWAR